MTIPELHLKYINETFKHPINENSKEGAYSDDYVSWLQNLVVNNEVLDLVSHCDNDTKDLIEHTKRVIDLIRDKSGIAVKVLGNRINKKLEQLK